MCNFKIQENALREMSELWPRRVEKFLRMVGTLFRIEDMGGVGCLADSEAPEGMLPERRSQQEVETDYEQARKDMLYKLGSILEELDGKARSMKIRLLQPSIFGLTGDCRATTDDIDHAAADLLYELEIA